MEFFIVIAVIVAFTVFPVMIAARILNAASPGFGACLLAVICSALVQIATLQMLNAESISYGLSLLISGVLFSSILKTGLLRGFAISFIATVIQIVATIVIGSALGG